MRRVVVLLSLAALLAIVLAGCTPTTPESTVAPPAAEAGPTVVLDPNATVKVESARAVREVLGEDQAVFTTLSPDGKFMAYYIPGDRNTAGQVCIYTFDGAGKKCTDLPLEQFLGYPYQLQWSPDGSRIAFTENPIDLGYDADIWVLDVASGAVKDLTDDGVTGAWSQPTGTPSSVVDYLPMWGPTDGQIYFWRFQNLGEYMKFSYSLQRIDPAGGEPVQVVDMGSVVPRSLATFTQEQFFMDGPTAMAPDGASVAALLTTRDDLGAGLAILYRIPLDGTAPTVLMGPETFNSAVPAWSGYQALPRGVSWTADGKGVVAFATTNYNPTPFTVFYYADAAGGTVTPLVDFSVLPDYESYGQPMPGSNNQIPARVYSPWTGGLSPKGDKVLMINDLGGTIGLLSADLPPTGALPVIAAAADASTMSNASRTSRSSDGKMTLYGLLLTVTE